MRINIETNDICRKRWVGDRETWSWYGVATGKQDVDSTDKVKNIERNYQWFVTRMTLVAERVTRDEQRVLYTQHHDARPLHTRVHMHTSVNKHCLARQRKSTNYYRRANKSAVNLPSFYVTFLSTNFWHWTMPAKVTIVVWGIVFIEHT